MVFPKCPTIQEKVHERAPGVLIHSTKQTEGHVISFPMHITLKLAGVRLKKKVSVCPETLLKKINANEMFGKK